MKGGCMKNIKYIKKFILVVVLFLAVFFNTSKVAAAPSQAKVLANTLNLRAGTSTATASLISIPKNTVILIESTITANNTGCDNNIWGKTTYGGKTGYVCTYHLEILNEPINPDPDPEPPAVSPGEYGEVKVRGKIHYGPHDSYSYSYELLASHNDPAFYINKYVDDEKKMELALRISGPM